MSTEATAAAGVGGLPIGSDALPFRIKTLNPDKAGVATFGLEDALDAESPQPKRLVVMSFFATYCEPCKREMPFLQALHEEYASRGLQLMSVSLDKEEDKIKEAQALAGQHGLSYPVLSDRFQVVGKRYQVETLPCLYFIDASSKVALVKVGYDNDASKQILAEVQARLGLPASVPARLAPFVGAQGAAPSAAETQAQPTSDSDQAATGDKKTGQKSKQNKPERGSKTAKKKG